MQMDTKTDEVLKLKPWQNQVLPVTVGSSKTCPSVYFIYAFSASSALTL